MSQRINITYSIKLENLELELKRLLTSALDKLEGVYTDNSDLESRIQLLDMDTFKDIDDLRQGLTEVDVALSDINNLISSYLNYEAQQLQPTPSPPSSDISPLANIDPDELNSKLAQFKQQWASANIPGSQMSDEISD